MGRAALGGRPAGYLLLDLWQVFLAQQQGLLRSDCDLVQARWVGFVPSPSRSVASLLVRPGMLGQVAGMAGRWATVSGCGFAAASLVFSCASGWQPDAELPPGAGCPGL